MRTLLLVDLDNIPPGVIVAGLGHPFVSEVLRAVLLLNLDTARGDPDPAAIGAALAGATRARLEGVEVALVAPVPQAADALLLPLLERSPFVDGAGEFGRVALLSRDQGLHEELAARLAGRKPTRHRYRDEWRWFDLPAPLRRKQLPPTPAPGEGALPAHYSAAVSTRSAALAAQQRPVEAPSGAGLRAVAAAIRERPHVLTQVGPTTASLRGLERLDRLLRAHDVVPIGRVGEGEGLEVHAGAATPPPTRVVPGPAPGLARLVGEERTVLCRIPPSAMIGLAAADFAPGPDGDLEAMRTLRALGGEGRVHLGLARGGFLRATVLRSPGEPPPIWWVDGTTGRATSELRLRISQVRLPHPIKADARITRYRDDTQHGLRLAAPPTRPVMVRVRAPAEAGHIVAVDHDGRAFAALLSRRRGAGEWEARPIASVPHHQLLPLVGRDLPHLLRLPLVVVS